MEAAGVSLGTLEPLGGVKESSLITRFSQGNQGVDIDAILGQISSAIGVRDVDGQAPGRLARLSARLLVGPARHCFALLFHWVIIPLPDDYPTQSGVGKFQPSSPNVVKRAGPGSAWRWLRQR